MLGKWTLPLLVLLTSADGFLARSNTITPTSFLRSLLRPQSRSVITHATSSSSSSPPSWDELASRLTVEKEEDDATTPMLTLYRDTNGWCPFCERVWLSLKYKGIPFEERLINLQDKPQWFLDMVPTGLVPAVLFHDDRIDASTDTNSNATVLPQRTLVWESTDIMKELDNKFPDTPALVLDHLPEYQMARNVTSKLVQAGFQFIYSRNNDNNTADTDHQNDKKQRRIHFELALDELDALMETNNAHNAGRPFLLGNDTPSGMDMELIPVMERWRYQLPLTVNLDVMKDRPNIQRWFEEAMDTLPPYVDRVAGDEYSWTAVSSYFLKIFGNNNTSTETMEAIERSDSAAQRLVQDFYNADDTLTLPAGSSMTVAEACTIAATKLIQNHDAIVRDCTNSAPKSQTSLPRASDTDTADRTLRAVVQSLLDNDNDSVEPISKYSYSHQEAEDAMMALETISQRLCVPRDMGAPSAKALRWKLMELKHVIESGMDDLIMEREDTNTVEDAVTVS